MTVCIIDNIQKISEMTSIKVEDYISKALICLQHGKKKDFNISASQ